MKKYKNIPGFKTEVAEQTFWSKEDSSDYIDWDKSQKANFPNLKPSTKSISIRLPEMLLDRIRNRAHKMDIPYQSLIKVILADSMNNAKS